MSVELYPTARDLEAKLSTLEDPALAERLLSSNPDLFTIPTDEPQVLESAAAREEISIFAAAWKRFGNIALAVTATASIVAGYVLTPMVVHRHPAPAAPAKSAVVQKARPAVAQKARPPSHPDAALRARVRHDEAEIARLRARLAVKQAAPAAAPVVPVHSVAPVHYVAPARHALVKPLRPVHHTAAAHHPAAVSHALPAAAYPAAAPQPKHDVDTAASAQNVPSTVVGSSASTSASTSTSTSTSTSPNTDTNVGTPDGTKNPPPSTGRGGGGWDHLPVAVGGIILGRTIDNCTPQGGRIGTVLQAVAGQILSNGGRL
jgi:hypothetical protein